MEGPYGNAMTEIALALAMAFFSVMVLAMVSMGTGSSVTKQAFADASTQSDAARLEVVRSEPGNRAASAKVKTRLVIYHQNRFLDADLTEIDPQGLAPDADIVLAIDPELALAEAITARTRISAGKITVTTLDERWMRKLKETEQ